MPRNDQVTRQWHLIRHLEAATRGSTLPELTAALPPELSRHPRTIRRDLEALEAAGFPLLTDRIEGRVVWKLIEGFRRIPALAFSPTELMALTFSRGLLRPLEGTQLQAALDSALTKAAAWAKDRIWHPSQQLAPQKDGRLRLTLKVAATPELVGWVLSFGGAAAVVRPDTLRDAVRVAAERIVSRSK
jgi:predicted DNA-binding transcriptional regulator YafY